MAASGSAPAATACSHWARPISAPSVVTMELSDMFWPLKGATDTPWRARSRQIPATMVDLPASDVVPHTMSAPPPGLVMRRREPWPPFYPGQRSCAVHADRLTRAASANKVRASNVG